MTFDQQIKDVIDKAARELSAQIDTQLRRVAQDIGQAAAADRMAVARDLRAAAEAEITRRAQEAAAAAQAEGTRRVDEAVSAAQAEGARRLDDAVSAARAEAARRVEEAVAAARAEGARRTEDAVARITADIARRIDEGVANARTEHTLQLEATIAGLRGDHARQLDAAVAFARDEAAERVDEAVRAARSEAERSHADALDYARAEAERQTAEAVEAARREAADTIQQSTVEVQAVERQDELHQLERLLDAVRRLDAARTLSEVLDVLADSSAVEAPRVAVFLLRGNRLQGWRFAGFGADADPRQMDLALDQAGLVTRALRAGRAYATSEFNGEVVSTPFGILNADCAGLAVPVRVGGETVAVVYADDAAASAKVVPSAWPEAVEMLTHHAARCLELVTVARVSHPANPVPEAAPSPRYAPHTRSFQASGDEDDDAARRYARLLVSEIKLYHEAAVAQGRRDKNLVERLRPEIDRARKLYEERVPASVRARTNHFGQELVRTLASGDASLLGTR